MKCLYCTHPYTYLLNDGQRKCSRCKRKFSPRKKLREARLWNCFAQGRTVRETSQHLKLHHITVQSHFGRFRKYVATLSEKAYQHNTHLVTDYDEYLYLPKSLKIEAHLDKLQRFITLSYQGCVYNLMMPPARHYTIFENGTQEEKLILKYLKFNKVAKMSTFRSTIIQFWEYFEEFILRYKGVSDAQFIFYLKEAEWRFNTQKRSST